MCGIVAVSSSSAQHFEIRPVLDTIQHRGPDDSGIFTSEQADCHLGHVRLAILDLTSAGHQPMSDGSSRFQICFNGEIYNFRDLQTGLVQRHGSIIWKSGTDTEIIVEGVAREGVGFLNRLNGIFALAIYDKQERLLHVLRDPLGVKPLFITEQNNGIFFCSELKGLLAFPGLKRTLRRDSLTDQIAFMYVPEPHTMYNEIRKVEPGICFSYRDGKQVALRRLFAHLTEPINISSEMEAVEQLQSAFATAVQRQLVADVPVSLFLSGGLDSSAVAQQAIQYGANIKDAYTIAFSATDRKLDEQSNDLHYARIMAKRLGIDLKIIEANMDFIELLPELMHFMEDGFTDPAAINTYLISARARREGVKVMLSGQGADEYLGGYRRYQAERFLHRFPNPLRSAFALSGHFISNRLPTRFNALRRRLARIANLAVQSPIDRQLGLHMWATRETLSALVNTPNLWGGNVEFEALYNSYSDNDIVAAMMKTDQRYDLLSLNLCYTDRMSMAVGVEVRVPFLDFDLVRVMNGIPVGLKLKRWQSKYILKKAMEPFLPHEIIYREKAGFGLPIRAWLRTGSRMVNKYLNNARIERQGIFNSSIVRRIIVEQQEGLADHSYTIFTLLCQQIWLEANHINC